MPAHNDDGSLPLTAANLDSVRTTSQTDKTTLIRDFVRSQEAYLTRYSKEGHAAAAVWDRGTPGAGGNTPERETSSREILVSAFDTPILKPRVPASAEDLAVRVEQPQGKMKNPPSKVEGSGTKPARASKSKTRLIRSESQKENALQEAGEPRGEHCGLPDGEEAARPRDKQQTLDRYTAKDKADVQKEASRKKRRHSPASTDSEHAARMCCSRCVDSQS